MMKCPDAKERLSAYIDNMLDKKEAQELISHLESCSVCKQELVFMKKCIDEMSQLAQINAPNDFQKNVFERIHRRSEFERLMRKAFSPAHKKIPLEFAGVLVTVLLVIGVFRYMQKEPPVFVQPEQVQPGAKGAPVLNHLDLNMNFGLFAPTVDRKKGMMLEDKALNALLSPQLGAVSWSSGSAFALKAQNYKTMELFSKSVPITLGVQPAEPAEISLTLIPVSSTFDKVSVELGKLIESLNGQVVVVEYPGDSAGQIITAYLPANNFPVFLEKIKVLAALGQPLSALPEYSRSVKLRIQLIPSK
jgi:hypothetical protein